MEILQIFVYIFGHDNVIDGAIGNADNFHLVGGGMDHFLNLQNHLEVLMA